MEEQKHNHRDAREAMAFQGYAPPTSSTTYTPNQFFDVVLPRASRGCLRLVAYLIRKTLGWSDEHGNPQNPEASVSYRELIDNAGIGRGRIKEAIQEALDAKYINCLRFGQPHKAGEEGFSALYSLRWDEREDYVTDPAEFDGFFAGNGNLTHIPNDFFDFTIPNEPLALVKVVGVIIRQTIGFQTKFGFRRQQIEISFSEIMRKAGIASRSTVNIALKEALDKHHICKVSEGYFDPHAGIQSAAATYGIKWLDSNSQSAPVKAGVEPKVSIGSEIEPGDRFQNRTGKSETVPKSNRGIGSKIEPGNGPIIAPITVPKSNQERFQNRTDIKTTNINNQLKQQQHGALEAAVAVGQKELRSIGLLIEAGFEREPAESLAARFTLERIERQVSWLPFRNVKQNRLGLLRKAIEEDWQSPESVQTSEHSGNPGLAFGAHFYASLAGREGTPVVTPSAAEVADSLKLVERLSRVSGGHDPQLMGQFFGRFVQSNQDSKRAPVRSLAFAIRAFGESFLAKAEEDALRLRKASIAKRREEHELIHKSAYAKYEESLLHSADEQLVSKFKEATNARLHRLKQMSQKAHDSMAARLTSESERARMFADFLREHHKAVVLEFWDWDRLHNPTPFTEETKE